MNPFKKSQMSKMETAVAALAKRGEQLAAKRVLALKTLDNAIKARQPRRSQFSNEQRGGS
jgi:acetyl-CoA carboxylase alpha subunit